MPLHLEPMLRRLFIEATCTVMTPHKLSFYAPESERRRWKIVRLDTMADVPGLILSANMDTGLCLLLDAAGSYQEYNFGPGGLWIAPA